MNAPSKHKANVMTAEYEEALAIANHDGVRISEVAKLLETAQGLGDHRATYALATWYLFGSNNFPKDIAKAVKMLKVAAKAEIAAAHFDLAVCYKTAQGVRKNYRKAYLHYLAAALYGDKQAPFFVADCFYFGIGVTKDMEVAEIWYCMAESKEVDLR